MILLTLIFERKTNKEYCVIFSSLYDICKEMFNQIWEIDTHQLSSTTLLDSLFNLPRQKYIQKEISFLEEIYNNYFGDMITQFKIVFDGFNSLVVKKNIKETDIYALFNETSPSTILTEGHAALKRCRYLALQSDLVKYLSKMIEIIVEKCLRGMFVSFLQASTIALSSSKNVQFVSKFLRYSSLIHSSVFEIGRYI